MPYNIQLSQINLMNTSNSFIQKYSKHPYYEQIALCNTLEKLQDLMINDKTLEISQNAKNCVFNDGNPQSKLFIIGEAPGENEDEKGIPFCGRSGKYLDKFLHNVGLFRQTNIYITNIVNWRPDGNRKPTEEEIIHCLPYLEKHIQLINPAMILTLGSTSTFALLDRSLEFANPSLGPLVAKTYPYKNYFSRKDIPIFVMYHPSYMMRKRNDEQKFMEYFIILKNKLNEIVTN